LCIVCASGARPASRVACASGARPTLQVHQAPGPCRTSRVHQAPGPRRVCTIIPARRRAGNRRWQPAVQTNMSTVARREGRGEATRTRILSTTGGRERRGSAREGRSTSTWSARVRGARDRPRGIRGSSRGGGTVEESRVGDGQEQAKRR